MARVSDPQGSEDEGQARGVEGGRERERDWYFFEGERDVLKEWQGDKSKPPRSEAGVQVL